MMSCYLCDELMSEIFERLPPKSLLRFRTLSKSWCSRIDSHDFIHKHNLRSVNGGEKVLIRHQKKDIREDSYTLHSEDQLQLSENMGITTAKFPSGDLDIVGSCNGIICLLDCENGISLWNPSIRRKLTVHEDPLFGETLEGVYVAVGFGFDPKSDDYKIVRIPYCKHVESVGNGNPLVYSIKTDTWCEIISSPTTPFCSVKSRACFVNGAFNWVVKSDINELDDYDDDIYHHYIMTFDLSSDVFGTIELPEPSWVTKSLTIIKGCLGVISNEGDNIWIWARKEDNNWSLFLKMKALWCEGRIDRVMQRTNGNLLYNTYGDGVKVYNVLTGDRSRLAELRSCGYKVDMETYMESLELLDKGIACEPEQRKRKRLEYDDVVMHKEESTSEVELGVIKTKSGRLRNYAGRLLRPHVFLKSKYFNLIK